MTQPKISGYIFHTRLTELTNREKAVLNLLEKVLHERDQVVRATYIAQISLIVGRNLSALFEMRSIK